MLGTVLGALLVTVIITRMSAGYAACAVIVVGFAAAVHAPHHGRAAARRVQAGPPGLGRAAHGCGFRRGPYPDFAWGWVTHFLVNLGNDLGTLYLLYFLARGRTTTTRRPGC